MTVGFCFGGSHSWRQSGGDLDLAGVRRLLRQAVVVGARPSGCTCRSLMLIAGADKATPVGFDQFSQLDTMRACGADVDAVVYDGAPHSFFDRAFGEWKDAGADSWRRILDFIAGHSPGHSQVGTPA